MVNKFTICKEQNVNHKKFFLFAILFSFLLSLFFFTVYAQTYIFKLDKEIVNVYWNEDGTQSLDYIFQFTNMPEGSPLDYVDVGLPNDNYDLSTITADVNGQSIYDIQKSPYVEYGVAVGLGNYQIQSGSSGTLHVFVQKVEQVLYPDQNDNNYVSADFSPTWFDSKFLRDSTNISVTFHFPPGLTSEEPRWHESPSGFPSSPETGIDDQGRIYYRWENSSSDASVQYTFGASFPQTYIPSSSIVHAGFLDNLGINIENLIGPAVCCGFLIFFIIIIALGIKSGQQRKLQYMPPKISIEGHGIKRGLTAIEAAILLEQPLDRILTMILFSVIKNSAAKVVTRDPLKLEVIEPIPADLRPYEVAFVEAFKKIEVAEQRKALQDLIIDLVKSISEKMKGFSRKETIDYYKGIVEQAWSQVESANTPEVRSQAYDEVMEWTMLDKDYEDRTKRVFQNNPVYVPVWWPRYDPSYHPIATSTMKTSLPTSVKPTSALPHLPGSDFAASMVRGVQTFSAGVIGDVTDFTSKITNKTNPVPVTSSTYRGSSRSGGSGCACACACACAGCACACAGGGR
jgi:hypothetical protein